MGQAKIQIQVLPDRHFPSNINMVIGQMLAEQLGIHGHPFRISFGSATETGYASISQSDQFMLRMSSRLANRLRISNEPNIIARFDTHTSRLKLGPLLGILINSHPKEHHEAPFGEMTRFLEECVQVGINQGIRIAVISPDLIHLESRTIHGYVKEQGKWKQVQLPLPDAIYNRITSRRIEQTASVQKKLDQLKNFYRVPIFNERFLNKHQVHQLLINDEYIRHLLPETHLYSQQTLKKMVQKHPILYLKPTNGSLGGGIIRLSNKDGNWVVQFATQMGTSTKYASSLTEVHRMLAPKLKKNVYIIQQGLSLAKYHGRQLDFRILVQKSRTGEWAVTSSIARIAGDQQIVSNVAKGGSLRRIKDILSELDNVPTKPSTSTIRNTALTVARSFEKQVEGHYAELGIDLALDEHGRIWLIEINSKPSKTDDSVANHSTNARPSVVRLIDYMIYLTTKHQRNIHSPPRIRSVKRKTSRRRNRT